MDIVYIDSFGGARVAAESEIGDAAVIAFAQLVSFVTDSNGQSVFLFRVECFGFRSVADLVESFGFR